MNQQLNAGIETVFLMADVSLQPIASKLVKEIAHVRRRDLRISSRPRCATRWWRGWTRIGRLGDY